MLYNADMTDSHIIIEFRAVGAQVKVTAVDPRTLTEVSIMGPSNASRHELEQLAVRKLEYVLKKSDSNMS